MLLKFYVIILVVRFSVCQEENPLWDLAVAINDQVELLTSNGTLVGSAFQQFSKLKALTFDSVRHQFVVSDMDQQNDTIFTVQLTKETDIVPILQDLPDDVQGLAVDPITDILYWTDAINRTINYVSLTDPLHRSNIFLDFTDENPQDIAVDSCRRYIYWTNSDIANPSIERATLDGKNREILVKEDLFMPAGIAIDHLAQRLYWADMREGIYYRIESTNLDGKERQIVYQGTHQKPFGLAVGKESIFWTDVNNNALWRKEKSGGIPEKVRSFKEKPMGLFAKNIEISTAPDCQNLAEAIKNYNESTTEYFTPEVEESTEITQCLNSGELTSQGCKCRRGFTGDYCETSICYNFCMHGNCYLTSLGYTQCHCPPGYSGSRCEQKPCDGYCLNGGECVHTFGKSSGPVSCDCPKGFSGERCEKSNEPSELCSLFCEGRQTDVLVDSSNTFVCRCEKGSYTVLETNNATTSELVASSTKREEQILKYLQDPTFIILSVCLLVMIVVIVVLSAMVFRLRRRPRIKKRIIVNKNVTPLTYRPHQSSEQCEITIENCCNMNVCETPCFEPPKLRSLTKKDEKKTLLSHMENGDDLY